MIIQRDCNHCGEPVDCPECNTREPFVRKLKDRLSFETKAHRETKEKLRLLELDMGRRPKELNQIIEDEIKRRAGKSAAAAWNNYMGRI